MPGKTDYLASAVLNFVTGQQLVPVTTSRFMALFTTPPSNTGSGGVEVSGGSYARTQIAGPIVALNSWTTSSLTINISSTPSWLTSLGLGVNIFDINTHLQIGTVSSVSGGVVTLTTDASNAGSAADTLLFSAFPLAKASNGTAPAITSVSTSNNAVIPFQISTASWGTVVAYGIYDTVTSGNLLYWDYIGNYSWIPVTVSSASPGIITTHAHNYSTGDPVVVTTKYGGVLPTFSQSNFTGILTVASSGLTTDAFSVTNGATAVNTSSAGDMMVRKIIQQSIPSGVKIVFLVQSQGGGGAGGGLDFSVTPDSQYVPLIFG